MSMVRGEWSPFFCLLPRKVDGRWVWLRTVRRQGWCVGCVAGVWSGWDYRLTHPTAGVDVPGEGKP